MRIGQILRTSVAVGVFAFAMPAVAQTREPAPAEAATEASEPATPPAPCPASSPAIALGQTVRGSLADSDLPNGARRMDCYRLRLRAGESFQADMTSDAFDSTLEVLAPGGAGEALKRNDDVGGGSLNSRLRFTAAQAGDYLLRAQSFDDNKGDYSLAVVRRTPAPPPVPVPLTEGRDLAGSFKENGPENEDDHPYALYAIEGRAGQRVRIDIVGEGFDPVVTLTREGGTGSRPFSASNDDGGDELNARLWAVLPETGRYRLEARSLDKKLGSYRLTLKTYAPMGPPPPPAALRAGTPVEAALSFDDTDLMTGENDDGSLSYFYRLYTLDLVAGQAVALDLKSSDFDPVLDVGVMSPLGFASAVTNDDSEGTDARLVLRPTQSGQVVIRARSINADAMGRYTLSVAPAAN